MQFTELNLAPELLRNVVAMGYVTPTPIQQQAIPAALEGRDVLGKAPTGTGKTAAFMLPTLHRLRGKEGLRCLVLCPTRELAIQVADNARQYAVNTEMFVGIVYGGVPLDKDLRDLRAGVEVLVATPGRLNDHLERGNVDLSNIEVLILDEADRMLDMGFKPQIDNILRRCKRTGRQTLFFSATMPNSVKSLAYEMLNDAVTVEAAPKVTTAEGVEQFVYPVEPSKKPELLLKILKQEEVRSALVFTRTKFGADRLAGQLTRAGLTVETMHSDRNMAQRVRALESFRAGEVKILIATDVAQRGIDVDGISHVINYDAPKDPEGYVHRVGRTARAGETGVAITFMSGGEIGDVAAVEHLVGARIPRVNVPGFSVFSEEGSETTTVTMNTKPTQKEARASRGRRMGKNAGKDLSPEELAKLLGASAA
ncbi:DEAD/DEAH box helicase [Longimicrobium terrae]|uniref:ATP-dependent RNA helicase RhlE n=1 Tax=Longimicrobium terrae TaxID=1639882 RepID=A0A841GY64_9BACT|nr:DEAD/DEAH box helicase [Longimicrobium terrae]MBB4636291.1 ATP-dependent RNA helicase RhlE [Longimicrobium terrae]MBB6070687.1 ATP-dependent RNA helicase RhlE [Longimicrobium terrae]NNC29669.1 DEAD/DEAH box helicase [Longimicrobium terrae]